MNQVEIKKRIIAVVDEVVTKPCSPFLMLQALAKDYVDYMTSSCIISHKVLVSSIGFSKYYGLVVEFAENFINEQRFIDYLKDEDSFKLEALCYRVGNREEGTNLYYEIVKGETKEEREARVAFWEECRKRLGKK